MLRLDSSDALEYRDGLERAPTARPCFKDVETLQELSSNLCDSVFQDLQYRLRSGMKLLLL